MRPNRGIYSIVVLLTTVLVYGKSLDLQMIVIEMRLEVSHSRCGVINPAPRLGEPLHRLENNCQTVLSYFITDVHSVQRVFFFLGVTSRCSPYCK